MSKYIAVTEAALDLCLLSESFSEYFAPGTQKGIYKLELPGDITAYVTAKEAEKPYFALVNSDSLLELAAMDVSPGDIYRRIARVVKSFKAPPIHLPRQWSEYHHKNLLAFFALSKVNSSKRWIADLDGDNNCVRFDVLTSSGADVNLAMYTPAAWPKNLSEIIPRLSEVKPELAAAPTANSLAAEVDLKAIGSTSVTHNRTYEQWLGDLTESQSRAIGHPINTSIRIVGPAGSGKTLALCMRAVQLSRNDEVIAKGRKILVVTHSWAMAERIDGVLTTLNGGQAYSGITTLPLLALLELHVGSFGHNRVELIGDDSSDGRVKSLDIIRGIVSNGGEAAGTPSLSAWINDGLNSKEDSRSRLELILNLYEEISGVISASGIAIDDQDSIRSYINSKREDWMPPFVSVADRGYVISIYRKFMQELIDRSSITTDQFILDAIRVLETFTWRMRKETEGYDYILVDELQLFDPQERSALELLGRSKKGVPFITAEDPSQGVFAALNTRSGIAQNEPVYLDTVHRFNAEIFALINFLYQKFPLNAVPLKIDDHKKSSDKQPGLHSFASDFEAVGQAVQLAQRCYAEAASNDRICIATLGDIDSVLIEALEAQKLPIKRLASFDDVEQLSYTKRSIIVAPWQFVGGTQFSHVILIAAGTSQPQSQFGKLRELISIYLSCSRAAQSLNIVCSSYIPSVIWEAKEQSLLTSENQI
ncbi:UvrD-helicase domain-containing protein [Pseudomonas aeruginosa]|uniref:UvrD-helicase domain-containing protein n=1 Tax=Pseudomonas aeruginosa TaxID=287 RepID=UPI0018AB972D|nr:UvrD-helicase domain-containing protein [Pseudomonas aeruginosa]MBF8801033.1 AAA family ATPase [Pseudomonas aeruginosa]HCL3482223.1 AAA family ATPase [Pseudomonas aeruginosa]